MCPLCEDCPTWTLGKHCQYFKLAYLFDNPGTVFYAILMSFWGRVEQYFLEIILYFFVYSRHISGVLEEEELHSGPPVGLYGLYRGGREAQAAVCS